VTEAQLPSGRVNPRSLSELIESFWTTQLIGTAVALGVADHLGEGAKSYEEIARACEADAPCVLRVLRGLQTIGVCRAGPGSTFELTDRGQLLRREAPGSLSGRASFTSGIMWDLYGQLTKVVKTGRSLPAGREGFNRLAEHPGLAGMHQAMVESSIRVIADACRVHEFGRYARVLDVGGGYGGALAALLQIYPDMSGAVLDLKYLAGDARAYLDKSGVSQRGRFLAGDFFESVPGGYDCYLLKYIVHDWDDVHASQILRNCASAADAGSHVILLERVMPEVLTESAAHQAIMQIDLAMMTTGGGERTEEQYRRLLSSAGLEITSVTATASPCSIIDAVRSV
jgi:orsellinic acid C2-O-methyltransferase